MAAVAPCPPAGTGPCGLTRRSKERFPRDQARLYQLQPRQRRTQTARAQLVRSAAQRRHRCAARSIRKPVSPRRMARLVCAASGRGRLRSVDLHAKLFQTIRWPFRTGRRARGPMGRHDHSKCPLFQLFENGIFPGPFLSRRGAVHSSPSCWRRQDHSKRRAKSGSEWLLQVAGTTRPRDPRPNARNPIAPSRIDRTGNCGWNG